MRPRDEGSQPQGDQGVILNLTWSGDGVWNVVYSVQATVGQTQQNLRLAIDTGSSDLWIASSSCSSSACSDAHTSLYNPAGAIQTGQPLSLTYLRGSVDGLIVWDNLTIGPYSIPAQAMVSASQVSDEILSSNFVGLLGLALPKNSNIAKLIPPTESDAPDGATFQQNVFGLTPVNTTPAQRFFGISLERPGSSRILSLLTIGKHPGNLLPNFDPSQINFMSLIPSLIGDTYWRVSLDAVTGWVDGLAKPVMLGGSTTVTNVNFPVAIIDTGGSLILATRIIANGIYGAWGIGPGSDGNYYIPCTTPMNMTISLGGMSPIPIHPLDLTADPPSTNGVPSVTDTCMGIIQASDDLDGIADMVLGVAFMRNVYAVLSSEPASNSTNPNATDTTINEEISPRLGLLSLTNPTVALQEFHSVRVLGQSLDPPNDAADASTTVVDKNLSVGIIILLAIIGFFILCIALFSIRWWILRRKFKKGLSPEQTQSDPGSAKTKDSYEMDSGSSFAKSTNDEFKNESSYAESTFGSERTQIEPAYSMFDAAGTQVNNDTPQVSQDSKRLSFSTTGCPPYAHLPSSPSSPEKSLSHDPEKTHRHSLISSTRSPTEHDENYPLAGANHAWLHSRSFSTSSATASIFREEFGMAGVGARNSVASASSGKEVRPRIQEDAYRSISLSIAPVTRLGDELGPIFTEDMLET